MASKQSRGGRRSAHSKFAAASKLAKASHSVLVEMFDTTFENYVPSVDCKADRILEILGLTDATIAELAKSGCTVISVDATLVLLLQKRGLRALNFNWSRTPDLLY